MRTLEIIGQYFERDSPILPWVHLSPEDVTPWWPAFDSEALASLTQMERLGTLAVMCTLLELSAEDSAALSSRFDSFPAFAPYVNRRFEQVAELTELPIPVESREKFQAWAESRLNFVSSNDSLAVSSEA